MSQPALAEERMMEDVTGGRINAEHITDAEWKLLEEAKKLSWWFTPTDAEWLAARGVLALVDVRRGYRIDPPLGMLTGGKVKIQFGEAQIRINEHGKMALYHRERGEIYQHGEPMTQAEIDRLLDEDF
jgi:hypothetical protein